MPRFRPLAPLVALLAACTAEPIAPPPPGGPPPGGSAAVALRLGGFGLDRVTDVAADGSGNFYATGWFNGSVDFDPGSGLAVLTSLGDTDIFLAKYTASGALVWARAVGGFQADRATGVAVDASGGAVIAGTFTGIADFDPGAGTVAHTSLGGVDGFVAKYSTDGAVLWARRFGGTGDDEAVDVAADLAGNVYLTGVFLGTADGSPNLAVSLLSDGAEDGFLLALDPSGGLRYGFRFGGPTQDLASAVTVAGGSVVVAGSFTGTADFDPGLGVLALTSLGGRDAFVAAYTTAGVPSWAVSAAGTAEQEVGRGGLAGDASGAVWVTGSFAGSTDFDAGPAQEVRTSLGGRDAFLLRLDPQGAFQSALAFGGLSDEAGEGLAVDGSGSVLVTGWFSGSADFDPGPGLQVRIALGTAGATDAFVAKYSSAGAVLWARAFGDVLSGVDNDTRGAGIAADGSNVLVGGRYWGTVDFDPGSTSVRLTSLGLADGFVVKLTAAGDLFRP